MKETKTASERRVIFLGKLGQGKTYLVNKLCGSHFPSDMASQSCTRTLQFGYTKQHGIMVIDTPGFYSSDDIQSHIAAQKYALEGTALSGIYAVVKFGRADDIAEKLGKVMDFVGNDDIRIIVTYGDIARLQERYNEDDIKEALSDLLDIPIQKLSSLADTSAATLESFIVETLHEPRHFEVSKAQLAYIATFTVGVRKYNKIINDTLAKLEAAREQCVEISTMPDKSYETDVILGLNQYTVKMMVSKIKEEISRSAQGMPPDQQNLVYGKVGLLLTPQLKDFIITTNQFFSWDVCDTADTRNIYRQCSGCEAVYCKSSFVKDCDELSTEECRFLRVDVAKPFPTMIGHFQEVKNKKWEFCYLVDGIEVSSMDLCKMLKEGRGGQPRDFKRHRTEGKGTPCGHAISWASMLPIRPDALTALTTTMKTSPIPADPPADRRRTPSLFSMFCCYWPTVLVVLVALVALTCEKNNVHYFF